MGDTKFYDKFMVLWPILDILFQSPSKYASMPGLFGTFGFRSTTARVNYYKQSLTVLIAFNFPIPSVK